jgi:hypothetical protein
LAGSAFARMRDAAVRFIVFQNFQGAPLMLVAPLFKFGEDGWQEI